MGVFATGRTPEGVDDLGGNVHEWTSSLFGRGSEGYETEHPYPYDARDGREDPEASPSVRRVVRGGGCHGTSSFARAAFRNALLPDLMYPDLGLRVAMAASTGA